MEKPVITVEHAYKSYKDVKAVVDLSFTVNQSTCFGFLGPNGAGKTTMMKMLYGKAIRDPLPETRITVMGYDPLHNELEIKNQAGVVPQDNNLDEELNVTQNLRIFSRFYNIPQSEAKKHITFLLKFMELEDKKNVAIRELSGGMKRRLIIARALLNNPKLLILDEPTTGLDPQVRQLIWDKMRSLKREGVTVLLSTHYMEEAYQIADTILIMHKGKKMIQGNPHQLLKDNLEAHVLEILDKSDLKNLHHKIKKNQVRREDYEERILLYADDISVLKKISLELKGGTYHLRPVNLEDLFLKITGRELSELQ